MSVYFGGHLFVPYNVSDASENRPNPDNMIWGGIYVSRKPWRFFMRADPDDDGDRCVEWTATIYTKSHGVAGVGWTSPLDITRRAPRAHEFDGTGTVRLRNDRVGAMALVRNVGTGLVTVQTSNGTTHSTIRVLRGGESALFRRASGTTGGLANWITQATSKPTASEVYAPAALDLTEGDVAAQLAALAGTRFKTSDVDTDATLAANSNSKVPSQAAIKSYVDAAIAGLRWKQPVRAATTAAGTLATSFENNDVIDGVTIRSGDRILIKNQAAPAENGIYVVNASGAPTRAEDANAGTELEAASVFVQEGTANADTNWVCTTDGISLGTTAITFVQFGAGGGQLIFQTVAVAGQSNVVADTTSDTLNFAGGGGVDITTDPSTDTVTITGYGATLISATKYTSTTTGISKPAGAKMLRVRGCGAGGGGGGGALNSSGIVTGGGGGQGGQGIEQWFHAGDLASSVRVTFGAAGTGGGGRTGAAGAGNGSPGVAGGDHVFQSDDLAKQYITFSGGAGGSGGTSSAANGGTASAMRGLAFGGGARSLQTGTALDGLKAPYMGGGGGGAGGSSDATPTLRAPSAGGLSCFDGAVINSTASPTSAQLGGGGAAGTSGSSPTAGTDGTNVTPYSNGVSYGGSGGGGGGATLTAGQDGKNGGAGGSDGGGGGGGGAFRGTIASGDDAGTGGAGGAGYIELAWFK